MSRDIEDRPDLHQGPVLFVFRGSSGLPGGLPVPRTVFGVDGEVSGDFAGGGVDDADVVAVNSRLRAEVANSLLEQALTLPSEDRAMLASGLLASLDTAVMDEADVDRRWSAETARRAAQLDAGEADLVSWEHVGERIDQNR